MAESGIHRRLPLASVAGAVAGLVVGVGLGYFGGSPLFGGVGAYALFPLVAGLVIFIILLVLAVWRRSRSAIAAPAVFVLAAAAGIALAPPPPGSFKTVAASATVGTLENPTACFSGSVRCEWRVGDAYVTDVTGFDLQVSEPAVLGALDLPGPATIKRLHLGMGGGQPGPEVALEYSAGAQPNSGSYIPLDLTDVGPGGRDGTAASGSSVVVSWTCSSGPAN